MKSVKGRSSWNGAQWEIITAERKKNWQRKIGLYESEGKETSRNISRKGGREEGED